MHIPDVTHIPTLAPVSVSILSRRDKLADVVGRAEMMRGEALLGLKNTPERSKVTALEIVLGSKNNQYR